MMTLSNVASRGLAWTRGVAVTSGFDQAGTTTEGNDLASLRAASALPPMTAETARRLAAILAPHLVAMRAVTAGTRYEGCVGGQADGDGRAAVGEGEASVGETRAGEGGAAAGGRLTADPGSPPLSPATKIFIAGMLDRISA
jgi:hypothetical protein